MHHNTITIGEARVTILLLSMVIHHNASRYNNYWRSPYHDAVSLNILHQNASRYNNFCRGPYHENVTLKMHHSAITFREAPITILLLSMSLHHNASLYDHYRRKPYHDAVTLNANSFTSQFITMLSLLVKPLSRYCISMAFIIMHHDLIT